MIKKNVGTVRTGEAGRIVRGYFTENRKSIYMAAVWQGVFCVMFLLSDISLKYLWYPFVICMAAYLAYMIYDMRRFAIKHRQLVTIMEHIDLTLENLPEASGLTEKDYQMLLNSLLERKNSRLSEVQNSGREAAEYATLWTHQIKTPVTAIRLLSENIEEPDKTELLLRLFEIENYADMMLQYIRLEGKGTDYVLAEYPVKSMINQAVKYFARVFISKGIAVQIDIPDTFTAVTDEKWLVFVFKQLISNALKYTEAGKITITAENENTVVIEDTGIGIAACDLPRIFERGYTGYNGRRDKKATGLGLYLTDRILKRLNCGIEIESEVNKGTRVKVNLKKL